MRARITGKYGVRGLRSNTLKALVNIPQSLDMDMRSSQASTIGIVRE